MLLEVLAYGTWIPLSCGRILVDAPIQASLPGELLLGVNTAVSAGRAGTDAQGSVRDLQLVRKPSEAQNLLSDLTTDEDAVSTNNEPQALITQQCNTDNGSSSAAQGAVAQQEGDSSQTSTSVCKSTAPISQAGIKARRDDCMTSRDDAETWDPKSSIPAAHQLRAVSAGDCFSLLLACSRLRCALC